MPLESGTALGPYVISGPLGAGGMGEVYKAKDTRLDRTVAIKILPAQFSSDPVRKQRFEREAKAISSLNHPHICVLFDVGHQDGVDFLVMEYVEGETLGERLARGPLPTEQVLRFGAQIAGALDRAHRSGIVHRDLKPGNIMLTPSGAKLLDFGLAKPAAPLATADTMTAGSARRHPMTEEGTILGTYQYMSPEQLQGGEVDARSDIFSLGAVLYEMVTGKRAFEGKSQLSVASAILERDPEPITALKPKSPAALDHAVGKCLQKHPDERWQSASDLAGQLRWIAEAGTQSIGTGKRVAVQSARGRLGWLVAAALLLVLLGVSGAWWMGSRDTGRTMYFYSGFPLPANDVALSPDGRTLATVAYWDQASKYMIWTQEVGGRSATPVPGTEDASHPFWSPDGRSIGFFAQGKLKKVDVSGRSTQVLCDAPNGRGGAWNRQGTILFTPRGFGGLYRVSSGGGAPVEVTKPDESQFESSHRWPAFLPDGRHFLYLAANFSGQFDRNTIFVGSLDGPEKRKILSASSNAVYAEPGYLLYVRDNAIMADRFDPRSYKLGGEPHTVCAGVRYFPQTDLALFDVAGHEILAAQTGTGAAKSQLIWFDREGRTLGKLGPPSLVANPAISPDGRRVVFEQVDADGRHVNIWIQDLARNSASRFTFGAGLDQLPIWSPDGKEVNFGSNRKLRFTLYQKSADGSGSELELADLGVVQQGFLSWSHDGKTLLIQKSGEIWSMSASDRQARPFLQAAWQVENGQFSPDGRWVAYSTNETGNWEVYVTPYPSANGKWQVSRGGGVEPRWKNDGTELFYLSGEGKMMAVPVKAGGSFEAGTPEVLFQAHLHQPLSAMDKFSYDVTADGQKFLINTKVDEADAAPVSMILNWAVEMDK